MERFVGRFTKVAETTELKPGQIRGFEAENKKVCMFNLDGEFFAIEDRCPHRGALLSEGSVKGEQVFCPWHGASFEIKTGEAKGGPVSFGVKSYRVKIEENDVMIELP